ncbi:zinc metalloprotease [Actinosynnema sp. ALI-1.44]|uniref:M50 family metallopeptidase n=1 Tax=Actinosynnema sp. ALI-1.44 TaxID=1933779 RepID=UPI00097C634B|nr:M50 family metallopeptidase [Actinosynnema sp. ALI-1.44]ONI79470.1 zinc metalloprotease [Actinosynnema sp. ALI-1.44]
MAYIAGIVLFALCVCLSLALHEAGHMLTARAFGMKVRRFFVGMGPTLFSFRRRGVEYGLKAIPIGGFCDISGMTTLDENVRDERPMWNFKTWQRTAVMAAGPLTHFLLGFLILFVMAMSLGLPNTASKPVLASTEGGAAAAAGIRPGDEIVSVAGKSTPTWQEMVGVVRAQSGPTPVEVKRGDQLLTFQVTIPRVHRDGVGEIGVIGASVQTAFQYGPVDAVGATAAYTGQMFTQTFERLIEMPQRIPGLVSAVFGGERELNSPVSVVGASRLGGEAAEAGLWSIFFLLLAGLNFFLGVFNLLPLLPMDGGHIAVTWYEKIRDKIRGLRGRPALGPVDYTRLANVTMALVVVGGLFVVLTITADIVNPIRLT